MDEVIKINFGKVHRSSSAKTIKSKANKRKSNIKILNEFRKISELESINTLGTQPIIIYKKEINNHNNIREIKLLSNNNIYISDGGVQKKIKRYSNSIPNKRASSTIKSRKKTKKFYPVNKKLEKSMTQEQIFSKTMIESIKKNKKCEEKKKNEEKNDKKEEKNEKKEKKKKKKRKKKKRKKIRKKKMKLIKKMKKKKIKKIILILKLYDYKRKMNNELINKFFRKYLN